MSSNKQMIGMAGVYLVAAELCLRGFIVSNTSRSAKGVDLLASTPDGRKVYAIQVKANADIHRKYWLIDKNPVSSKNLFYVFVRINKQNREFYVVQSSKVKRKAYHERFGNAIWNSYVPDSKDKDNWSILK